MKEVIRIEDAIQMCVYRLNLGKLLVVAQTLSNDYQYQGLTKPDRRLQAVSTTSQCNANFCHFAALRL
jgi:hypothetical protein